jgi:hypothetical protein
MRKRTPKHPIYNSWRGMIDRCTNPNNKQWHRYGGRGISVAPEWMVFANFHRDMASGWAPGLSNDRINNDGNYEPGNCRWATPKVQRLNTTLRINMIDTPWGRMTLGEAAERSGLDRTTIYSRLQAGRLNPFDPQHSNIGRVSWRKGAGRRIVTPWGELTVIEAAQRSGLKEDTLRWRLKHGGDLFRPPRQGGA